MRMGRARATRLFWAVGVDKCTRSRGSLKTERKRGEGGIGTRIQWCVGGGNGRNPYVQVPAAHPAPEGGMTEEIPCPAQGDSCIFYGGWC
jgi:hypothetical protein